VAFSVDDSARPLMFACTAAFTTLVALQLAVLMRASK
jgi:hypothetical protein